MISGNSCLQVFLKQLDPDLSYREMKASLMSEFERIYVNRLLENHHGNLSIAARSARMDRKHLYDLITKPRLEDVRKKTRASSK